MENPAFGQWVEAVLNQRFGGVRERLAEAIGVTLTTLSRGIETGTLGADTLLRLALVTGRDASEVLRLAKKAEWAALIEECYGQPRPVAPAIREIVALLEEGRLYMAPAIAALLKTVEAQSATTPADTAPLAARPRARDTPRRRESLKQKVV